MKLVFGEKHPEAIYRKSIGAIIIHPEEKDQVLALDWRIYDVYGIVQGGMEETDEDEVGSLKREIVEESGFTDFSILEKLGENIVSYFFVDVKNVWRELELACYLVKLNSLEVAEQMLEDHESFDLKWISIDDFINQTSKHKPTKQNNFQGLEEFLRRAKQRLELV